LERLAVAAMVMAAMKERQREKGAA